MSASGPPDPWERQPYDTEESWRAFVIYRDDTLRRRSIMMDGRAISPIKVEGWMTAHFWRERCAEYDRHLDSGRREVIERVHLATAHEVAAQHKIMLEDARNIAMTELAKLRERVGNSNMECLKPNDLNRLVDTIVKLDRLIRGETTENVQVADLSHLTDAELEALDRMANRSSEVDDAPDELTSH